LVSIVGWSKIQGFGVRWSNPNSDDSLMIKLDFFFFVIIIVIIYSSIVFFGLVSCEKLLFYSMFSIVLVVKNHFFGLVSCEKLLFYSMFSIVLVVKNHCIVVYFVLFSWVLAFVWRMKSMIRQSMKMIRTNYSTVDRALLRAVTAHHVTKPLRPPFLSTN